MRSVLDAQTKKQVGEHSALAFFNVMREIRPHCNLSEILIQRVKKLQPEVIAKKIQDFDSELCTQVFLSGLKPLLPTPEQVRTHCMIDTCS